MVVKVGSLLQKMAIVPALEGIACQMVQLIRMSDIVFQPVYITVEVVIVVTLELLQERI